LAVILAEEGERAAVLASMIVVRVRNGQRANPTQE